LHPEESDARGTAADSIAAGIDLDAGGIEL
jgi:hypothetical protein